MTEGMGMTKENQPTHACPHCGAPIILDEGNRDGKRPDGTTTYVSQQEAAARWSVHVDTIRRLVAGGKVTGYRLNRRVMRVDLAEVDACFRPIPTTGSDR